MPVVEWDGELVGTGEREADGDGTGQGWGYRLWLRGVWLGK